MRAFERGFVFTAVDILIQRIIYQSNFIRLKLISIAYEHVLYDSTDKIFHYTKYRFHTEYSAIEIQNSGATHSYLICIDHRTLQ